MNSTLIPTSTNDYFIREENARTDNFFWSRIEQAIDTSPSKNITKSDNDNDIQNLWSSVASWNGLLDQINKSEEVENKIRDLLDSYNNNFEEEEKATLANRLFRAINDYGYLVLIYILIYVRSDKVNPFLAVEVLQLIGEMAHPPSHSIRRWVLETCLQCPSKYVRDGAGLGLAFMDDPHAINYVKKAIASETSKQVRKNLKLVLSQLEKITTIC